jgi:hypothetical protein
MAKDDEQITMTKADLEELLATRERDAKMDPSEKRVRQIVREESEGVFKKVLAEFFDAGGADDDDKGSGGENDGGALGGLGKVLGIGG